MAYERMYADNPDQWEPVSEAEVRRILSGYYDNVDEVLKSLDEGAWARTIGGRYRRKAD